MKQFSLPVITEPWGRRPTKGQGRGSPPSFLPHATSPSGIMEEDSPMQTPEPERNGERSSAPHAPGARTKALTARGAEGPRGHETLEEGIIQPDPRHQRQDAAKRG